MCPMKVHLGEFLMIKWIKNMIYGLLYTMNNQHIYVNRGFGFMGYPGRVGILPEITILTLKRS